MVRESPRLSVAHKQVVPLNEVIDRSIGAELSGLGSRLRSEWRAESPEAGLVEWAARSSGTILRVDTPPFTMDGVPDSRWSEAPVLAAVGYRIEPGTSTTSMHERWVDGVSRLMSRDAAPVDRNSFFFRPVELLGIALGASALRGADPRYADWMRNLIDGEGHQLRLDSIWSTVLTTLAAREVACDWTIATRLDPKTTVDVGTLLWLHLVDASVAMSVSAADHEELCRRLLLDVTRLGVISQGVAESGIVWIALERAVLAAIDGMDLRTRSAIDFVVTLCRRFPLLVSELSRRHGGREPLEVKDEYDVQDLLRALLRVHFDDVRPEEWNPSYGGVASRSDLLIKSERLVIETKMTRKNLGQREVVEELTVDKAQYRTHPECETLLCFVYDPGKRLSNPTALEADLSSVDADLATRVVVSPRGL